MAVLEESDNSLYTLLKNVEVERVDFNGFLFLDLIGLV
jgi:hypothetical protein